MVYKDNPAITSVFIVEAQWSDIPEDVYEEIRDLWYANEYGNDHYYYSWISEDFATAEDDDWAEEVGIEDEYRYKKIAKYLRDNGLGPNDKILIHYWW
jgi:hypothetical protein